MIRTRRALFVARSLSSSSSLSPSLSFNRFFRGVLPLQQQLSSIFATDDNHVTPINKDMYLRPMSKMTRILHSQDERQRQQQEIRTTIHQQYYPDSFVYRRGDHPYGTREYLLVRPQPKSTDDDGTNNKNINNGEITKSKQEKDRNIIRIPQYVNQNTKSSNRTTTMMEPNLVSTNQELQILATLHANNNIVFGANINHNVIHYTSTTTSTTPTILDLCPILLHTALMDCSNEGEQPQALATLHGLSAWVRQCLFILNSTNNNSIQPQPQPQSHVLQALQQQMQSSTSTTLLTTLQSETLEHVPRSSSSQQQLSLQEQLECITAMATNVPRPGHSVVGQKTYAGGAAIWEALAREYAVLENDTRNTTDDASSSSSSTNITTRIPLLSEECLLYRHYTESCELVEIELLADTSPSYLLSAGGAMARFFIM